ncbi:hypothetical protein ZOD2009_18005 [Haladaptatus paucihalophilus DX253]|uniref:DUF378 domain-containing protein n=1 Tax=Haladaptatus paucihalophilus DX253 TaxID=797209 RepID=E7QXR2_HALPU|nr:MULTISPECIES: DUF378 domain-containing protein [Haladaptatus]EFW90613.1 hypothetical protein ZOD2009_18005 [Haladaptatus paucihalophilus DX253]GKZ14858.1 hypothetical protein HAL_27390 [Haladaptatus sp. T7]SHL57231.1 hypothetical protein SAMN05444342_4158 [Haladaptatus paucihalophilus DX253]
MATNRNTESSDGIRTNGLDWFSMLLIIIGALNWGILGITDLTGGRVNVVRQVAGLLFLPNVAQVVTDLIYVLVGLAGLYFIYTSYKIGRASRQTRQQAAQQTEPRRTE